MKRVFSLVTVLVLILSMVPSIFAAEDQLPPDLAASGTQGNPAQLTIGSNTAVINAGCQGYYYTWTAEKAGTVSVVMPADMGWTYVIQNVTTGETGAQQWSDGENAAEPVQFEVAAGDKILLMVNTYDPADKENAPAGKLSFEAIFAEKEAEDVADVGDVDGNGKVNLRDALMLLQHVNGKELAATPDESACDVDGNGRVNLRDALMLLQIVNGKEFK